MAEAPEISVYHKNYQKKAWFLDPFWIVIFAGAFCLFTIFTIGILKISNRKSLNEKSSKLAVFEIPKTQVNEEVIKEQEKLFEPKLDKKISGVEFWENFPATGKLKFCERLALNFKELDIDPFEALFEIQKFSNFIKSGESGIEETSIENLVELSLLSWKIDPFVMDCGSTNNSTPIFAIGKKRFLEFEWRSIPETHLGVFLVDYESGNPIEQVISTMNGSGKRKIWINPGLYYFDIIANGEWEIFLHKNHVR